MASVRKTYQAGLLGEIVAAIYLMLKGYRLLAWRYKTPVGEIDLVAKSRTTLVFVEVKVRPTGDEGLFAVTPRMQTRISNAARYFTASHPRHKNDMMRFDVVTVCPPCSVRHLDNAWQVVP